MIAFVLDADRQHTLSVQDRRVAVAIEIGDSNSLEPRHGFVESWYRQAAFLGLYGLAVDLRLGIDESVRLVAVFRDIDHDDAHVHVHLAGCEADAGCGIHGLIQVVDQRTNLLIDSVDGSRFVA